MSELFTLENFGTLLMLRFLQAVLGFDKNLYISIESQRAPVTQQNRSGSRVLFWRLRCV